MGFFCIYLSSINMEDKEAELKDARSLNEFRLRTKI